MGCGINRPVLDLGVCGIFAEEVTALPVPRRPDGSRDEPAAAIRANVIEDSINARRTERTFVSANACFHRVWWQRLVAVFAGRTEF
jgi:hypothetical protein